MAKKRLAIVCTHPVQYNAPMFRRLCERSTVDVKVFYTYEQWQQTKFDSGFGQNVSWDIPILEGYDYEFAKNTASKPSLSSFLGIRTPQLAQQITAWKADAVLVYGWNYRSHLSLLRSLKNKIPLLFRGDSTLIDESPGLKTLLRRHWLRWVYTHTDYALYTGTHNKAYFAKHGLQAKQLFFAPHATDNRRFAVETSENALLRSNITQTLHIPPLHTVFVFAAKFEHKKAPLLLLSAFARAKAANNNISLIMAGDGVLKKEAERVAASVADVHFLPFQNQTFMPSLYRMGNVYVLPSAGPGETWGLAVNEAMAAGCALIASNRCGCTVDLVQNDVNGYSFEAGNVEQLAQRLLLLADNKERTAAMGGASQQIIDAWTFDRICLSIEQVVGQCLP